MVMILFFWIGKLFFYLIMMKFLYSLGVFFELLVDIDYDKLVLFGNFEDEFILEIKNLGFELDIINDFFVIYFILEGGSFFKFIFVKFLVYLGCDFELICFYFEEGGVF